MIPYLEGEMSVQGPDRINCDQDPVHLQSSGGADQQGEISLLPGLEDRVYRTGSRFYSSEDFSSYNPDSILLAISLDPRAHPTMTVKKYLRLLRHIASCTYVVGVSSVRRV